MTRIATSTSEGSTPRRRRAAARGTHRVRLVVCLAAAGVLAAACSSDSVSDSEAAPTSAGESAPGSAEVTTTASAADTTGGGESSAPTSTGDADAASCGEPASGEPIVIGTLDVQSGPATIVGATTGLRAFFGAYNECGGYGGRPVEVVAVDGKQDPQQIAAGARQLVDQGAIALAGTSNAADCVVNGEYYAAEQLPVLSLGLTPPCYTSPNIFVTNMGTDSLLPAAKWAVEDQGKKTVAFTGFDIPGIRDQGKFIAEYLQGQGLELVFEEYVPLDGSGDMPGVATRLAQAKPDAVITVFSEQLLVSVLDLADTQGAGISDGVTWIGATGLYGEKALDTLGGLADGLYILSPFYPYDSSDEAEIAKLNEAVAAYQPEGSMDGFVQMGWNAGLVLAEAFETMAGAEPTRENLLAALQANGGIETSLYPAPLSWATLPQKPPAVGFIVRVDGDKFVVESDLVTAG
jgi:branched-chain amino acid transport system substrate-binding protein